MPRGVVVRRPFAHSSTCAEPLWTGVWPAWWTLGGGQWPYVSLESESWWTELKLYPSDRGDRYHRRRARQRAQPGDMAHGTKYVHATSGEMIHAHHEEIDCTLNPNTSFTGTLVVCARVGIIIV